MRMARSQGLELHLDLVGGLAGDMFVAALIDLAPNLELGIGNALRSCGHLLDGVSCKVEHRRDGPLAGRRFVVTRDKRRDSELDRRHRHVDWRMIRSELEESALKLDVKRHAIAIFGLIAEAEARVHGGSAEEASFHEVGAWDSIADVVASAYVIDAIAASKWTVSAIPLGSGRVETAHGILPVPAPAAALLLEGFATIDDGVGGERVTPTGAAILRYLVRGDALTGRPRRLVGSSFGFGSRRLEGLSNCVRVLQFEPIMDDRTAAGEVAVIEFEIDDQSPEDLALGLDRVRSTGGVYDIVQTPAFGKKGRLLTSIRILTDPSVLDAVATLCFEETTTIGLRHRLERRTMLFREQHTVKVGERAVRVKTVRRPDGPSAKAEADDLAGAPGRLARDALRQLAEREKVREQP